MPAQQVPPLPWLIAAAARQFTPDPHLYSGFNYIAGILIVQVAIRQHALMTAREAKR